VARELVNRHKTIAAAFNTRSGHPMILLTQNHRGRLPALSKGRKGGIVSWCR